MFTLRNLAAPLPVAIPAGLFLISFLIGYRAQSQDLSTPWKPFVAHLEVFKHPSKGSPVMHRESYARRSDGSYVRSFEARSPSGELGWVIEIHDLRKGTSVVTEPFTRRGTTVRYSERDMREWLETQPNCTTAGVPREATPLPAEPWSKLLGRDVKQIRQGSDADTTDLWVAPALDCYPLKKSEKFKSGSHNEFTVLSIEEGEPSASTFEIPSGYVESSPLEIEAAYVAKFPGHVLFGKMVELINERYTKARVGAR